MMTAREMAFAVGALIGFTLFGVMLIPTPAPAQPIDRPLTDCEQLGAIAGLMGASSLTVLRDCAGPTPAPAPIWKPTPAPTSKPMPAPASESAGSAVPPPAPRRFWISPQ